MVKPLTNLSRYFIFLMIALLPAAAFGNGNGELTLADKYGLAGEETGDIINAIGAAENPDRRFALTDQAVNNLRAAGREDLLLLILDEILHMYPDDPYKAYYYSLFADYYRNREALPLAEDYYRRILYNTQDLILDDQSIHLMVLREWLSLHDNRDDRITIYEMLISQFPDRINLGECYYYLAEAYEERGDFDKSLEYYERFLNGPETEIPGVVEAREKVEAMIAFHKSNKNWTFETLDDLVNAVKYAIGSRRIYLLDRYQSENFFILSWSQKMMNRDEDVTIGGLTNYSTGIKRIYYSSTLEAFSNDQEAYLKTWGWSYRVKPWYLYFRRIDYPRDPDINGRWEWVGIYMGQPL